LIAEEGQKNDPTWKQSTRWRRLPIEHEYAFLRAAVDIMTVAEDAVSSPDRGLVGVRSSAGARRHLADPRLYSRRAGSPEPGDAVTRT